MRLVKRVDDEGGRREGSYEGGYGTQDAGEGSADGYGYGWSGAGVCGYLAVTVDGSLGIHNGAGLQWHGALSVTNHSARRTERVFLCPGCIGGFECSIHGRRL